MKKKGVKYRIVGLASIAASIWATRDILRIRDIFKWKR